MRAVLEAAVGMAIAITLSQPASADPTLDHFTCYRSRTTAGTDDFRPHSGTTLVDRFGSRTATVWAQERLCTPTSVNGGDPTAPAHPDRLMGYLVKKVVPHFDLVHGLTVTNEFGASVLDARQLDRLLVPTATSLAAPPPPLVPTVDHFSCYRVKRSSGAAAFGKVLGIMLEDQFGTMQVDIKAPRKVCVPVDKNGETPGAGAHTQYLVCYPLKRSQGTPAFATVDPIYADNQFGPWTIDARTPYELCVPSTLSP